MSFIRGVQAANTTIQQDRAERQAELTNYIKGFQKNAEGSYEANARGQAALSVQEEQMKSQLVSLQSTNELLAATMNAKDFGTTVEHLAMGKHGEAIKQLNNSPMLKAKLKEQFGVVTIAPVDWASDAEGMAKKGIHVTEEDLKDPIKLNALNSTFFKIVKPDGSTEIASVPVLMQTMNYEQYASADKIEGLRARNQRIQEILAGNLKSPEQRQLEEEAQKAKLLASKDNNNIAELRSEVLNNVLNDSSLSAEEKLAKLTAASTTTDYKTLQAQLNLKKTVADMERATSKEARAIEAAERAKETAADIKARKDAKLAIDKENEKRDAELDKQKQIINQQKIDKGKPVEHEVEFRKNLHEVEYNDGSLKIAKKLQGESKLSVGTQKDLRVRKDLNEAFADVYKDMATAKYDKNAWQQIGKILASVTTKDMSFQDAEPHLTALKINTKLQDALFRYVKLMSGAAVSDTERANYTSIIAGGTWSDKPTALATLGAFTGALGKSVLTALDSIKYATPADYLTRRDEYKNAVKASNDIMGQYAPKAEDNPTTAAERLEEFNKNAGKVN